MIMEKILTTSGTRSSAVLPEIRRYTRSAIPALSVQLIKSPRAAFLMFGAAW
jgi:hypothetical protein